MNNMVDRQMLRDISAEALANFGAPELAYVRAIETPAGPAFGIFAANGVQVGVVPEREVAFAAARQHDLDPVSVH
jgi:hypothetical protein